MISYLIMCFLLISNVCSLSGLILSYITCCFPLTLLKVKNKLKKNERLKTKWSLVTVFYRNPCPVLFWLTILSAPRTEATVFTGVNTEWLQLGSRRRRPLLFYRFSHCCTNVLRKPLPGLHRAEQQKKSIKVGNMTLICLVIFPKIHLKSHSWITSHKYYCCFYREDQMCNLQPLNQTLPVLWAADFPFELWFKDNCAYSIQLYL